MKQLNEIKDWKEMINVVVCGDCLEGMKLLPDECVDCVITSPPYWALRDYGVDGQIGREPSYLDFIQRMVEVFNECKRILKPSGTLWLNLGDTYGGTGDKKERVDGKSINRNGQKEAINKTAPEKCLLLIPSRVAIAMIDSGWILRNDIIWHKSNAMPSSVLDRLTNKYEHFFFFTKSKKYFFDLDKIRIPYEGKEPRPPGIVRSREKGYNSKFSSKYREQEEFSKKSGIRRATGNKSGEYQNPRGKIPGDVWTFNLQPSMSPHIAMYPEKVIVPMIAAGCSEDGIVFDPFMGGFTTARVAKDLGRDFIGFELSPEYCKIGEKRLQQEVMF